MKYELTMEQRDSLMGQLSEEQRHFIHHELVRGRRTLFARQLARKKCQFIPEDAEFEDIESSIEEWDYIGFTDSGEVSPHTKCECGRSLRYQHQVLHLPTNTMRYFGIEHLQLHTGIDAKAISAILKGFDVLDGEMNEILYKYHDGWQLEQYVYLPLPDEVDVPQDIQAHLDAKLPLLDRQLARLRSRLREQDHTNRQKRLAAAISNNIGTEHSTAVQQMPYPDAQTEEQQSEFVLDESTDGQGAFVFGEADIGQGAFNFDEIDNGQAAFVFDDTDSSQSRSGKADEKQGTAPARESGLKPSGGYITASSNPFYLSSAAERVVDDALKYGRISTRSVSEFLIEQKLAHDGRMSTGKPSIYIAVAAYLDKLAASGKCALMIGSAEDREYSSSKAAN